MTSKKKNKTTREEILNGYDDAVIKVQNWKPSPNLKDQDEKKIGEWRSKTIAKILAGKEKFLATGIVEKVESSSSKMKLKLNRDGANKDVVQITGKLANVKSMEVTLLKPLMIGDVQTLDFWSKMKKKKILPKGEKVRIEFHTVPDRNFYGICVNGLILKVSGKEKTSRGYATLDGNNVSVQEVMASFFKPTIKNYDSCSIIPDSMKKALVGLRIKLYKERPSQERYLNQILALVKKAA